MIENKNYTSENLDELAHDLELDENGFLNCRFEGIDARFLNEQEFVNCSFTICNMAGQNFDYSALRNCIFQHCNFRGSAATNLSLRDTSFYDCDFNSATFYNVHSEYGDITHCDVSDMVLSGLFVETAFDDLKGKAYASDVSFECDSDRTEEMLREKALSQARKVANNIWLVGSNASQRSFVLSHLKHVGIDARNRLLGEVRENSEKLGLKTDEAKLEYVQKHTQDAVEKARRYLLECRKFYEKYSQKEIGKKSLTLLVEQRAEKYFQQYLKELNYDISLPPEQRYADRCLRALTGGMNRSAEEEAEHVSLADRRLQLFAKKEAKREKLIHSITVGSKASAYNKYLGPADNQRKSQATLQKDNDVRYARPEDKQNRDDSIVDFDVYKREYRARFDDALHAYLKKKKELNSLPIIGNTGKPDPQSSAKLRAESESLYNSMQVAKRNMTIFYNLGEYVDQVESDCAAAKLRCQDANSNLEAVKKKFAPAFTEYNEAEARWKQARQNAIGNRSLIDVIDNNWAKHQAKFREVNNAIARANHEIIESEKALKQAEDARVSLYKEFGPVISLMKRSNEYDAFIAHSGVLDYMGNYKAFGSKSQQNEEIFVQQRQGNDTLMADNLVKLVHRTDLSLDDVVSIYRGDSSYREKHKDNLPDNFDASEQLIRSFATLCKNNGAFLSRFAIEKARVLLSQETSLACSEESSLSNTQSSRIDNVKASSVQNTVVSLQSVKDSQESKSVTVVPLHYSLFIPPDVDHDNAKVFALINSLEKNPSDFNLVIEQAQKLDKVVTSYFPEAKCLTNKLSYTKNPNVIDALIGKYALDGNTVFSVNIHCERKEDLCSYTVHGNVSTDKVMPIVNMLNTSKFFDSLAVYGCTPQNKPLRLVARNDASVEIGVRPEDVPKLDMSDVDKGKPPRGNTL